MKDEQKNILEQIVLNKIQTSLDSTHFIETLILVEYCKKHQLLYPLFFDFVYHSLIAKNIFKPELFHIIENRSLFNVNIVDCSQLLEKSLNNCLVVLENKFLEQNNFNLTFSETLEKIFSLGVFFENNFLESEVLNAYTNNDTMNRIKDKNVANRAQYLEKFLILKDATTIQKI